MKKKIIAISVFLLIVVIVCLIFSLTKENIDPVQSTKNYNLVSFHGTKFKEPFVAEKGTTLEELMQKLFQVEGVRYGEFKIEKNKIPLDYIINQDTIIEVG